MAKGTADGIIGGPGPLVFASLMNGSPSIDELRYLILQQPDSMAPFIVALLPMFRASSYRVVAVAHLKKGYVVALANSPFS